MHWKHGSVHSHRLASKDVRRSVCW